MAKAIKARKQKQFKPASECPTPREDLAGRKFGRLEVVAFAGRTMRGMAMWKCVCQCGADAICRVDHLIRGSSRSCGCLREELRTKHGLSRSGEHHVWKTMRQRCSNKNNRDYPFYGGRGITVCQRWMQSFEAFYSDMGPRPSSNHSIDRINNDDGYHPDNCRWVTHTEQCSNRRSCVILTFGGESKTITQWAASLGISSSTIQTRRNAGWSDEAILSTPIETKFRRKANRS